jgi:hypothetical protein
MAHGSSIAISGHGPSPVGGVQPDAAHHTSGSEPTSVPVCALASVMKTARSMVPRSSASLSGVVRSKRNLTLRAGEVAPSSVTMGGSMWSAA